MEEKLLKKILSLGANYDILTKNERMKNVIY